MSARVCADATAPVSYADAHARMLEAYQAGNYATMADRVRSALALRPDYPPMLYNLAVAEALGGHSDAALGLLSRLAAMGLEFPAADDEDLASLRGLGDFPRLRAAFAVNSRPTGSARVTFTIDDGHFIPEGLAYDSGREAFLLGSIRSGRVARIARDGAVSLWSAADEAAGLSAFGMAMEPGGDHLVVAYNAAREHAQPSAAVPELSGIAWLNAADGKLRKFCALDEAEAGAVLGDVFIPMGGTIYVADSVGGAVYELARDDCRYSVLVQAGRLFSPQGMTASADGSQLYIADYRGGIFVLDIDSGGLSRLAAPENATLYGIDGLYRKGVWLIGVQNGLMPHRIVALRLAEEGKAIDELRVLAANLPQFDEPAQGAIVGESFHFIANSHWNRFDGEARLPPENTLSGPVVLAVPLP
ncbi:MAG: hypothetical protein ACREVN_07745 [Gammaproteobacteria bacterium]